MKTVLVILLVCCIFVTSNAFPGKTFSNKNFERRISNGMVQQVEKLRKLINNGDAALGIPVLDPFKHPVANILIDTSELNFKLVADDITIKGLGHFEVSNVDVVTTPSLGVRFTGSVPLTSLDIDKYSAVLKIDGTTTYGVGVAHLEGVDLSFSGDAKISEESKGVSLKDLKLSLKLSKLKSSTTGMIGGGHDDEYFNTIIEEKGADYFNNNNGPLANLIGDKMLINLNKLLVGMSSDDLVNLITG